VRVNLCTKLGCVNTKLRAGGNLCSYHARQKKKITARLLAEPARAMQQLRELEEAKADFYEEVAVQTTAHCNEQAIAYNLHHNRLLAFVPHYQALANNVRLFITAAQTASVRLDGLAGLSGPRLLGPATPSAPSQPPSSAAAASQPATTPMNVG